MCFSVGLFFSTPFGFWFFLISTFSGHSFRSATKVRKSTQYKDLKVEANEKL